LKIAHRFSKFPLEDLLKFFRIFSKEVSKIRIAYFLWKRSLPKIFLRSFENLALGNLAIAMWHNSALAGCLVDVRMPELHQILTSF